MNIDRCVKCRRTIFQFGATWGSPDATLETLCSHVPERDYWSDERRRYEAELKAFVERKRAA